MPYIEKDERPQFQDSIWQLANAIRNKGELNYVISELVGTWIVQNKLFSYTGISNAISAVHDSELELVRRLLIPYEAGKIVENEDLDSFKKVMEALEFIRGGKEPKTPSAFEGDN